MRNIYFFGDAPITHEDYIDDSIFDEIDSLATVYFLGSATGFTTPEWAGLPSVNIAQLSEAKAWLVENSMQHETLLSIDPLQSGLPLLVNFGFNQAPGFYEPPRLERLGNQLTYHFFGTRSDVTYAVELSKDLATWSAEDVVVSEPDQDGYRTASLNLNDGRCFVRFRFVQES